MADTPEKKRRGRPPKEATQEELKELQQDHKEEREGERERNETLPDSPHILPYDQLREALAPGMIQQGGYGKGLSSIKPMAITQRLNEVLGAGNWTFHTYDFQTFTGVQTGAFERKTRAEKDPARRELLWKQESERIDHVVCRGKLTVSTADGQKFISYDTVGGSTNTDIGDMYKGAMMDALTKASAHFLGVAEYVYLGQSKPQHQGSGLQEGGLPEGGLQEGQQSQAGLPEVAPLQPVDPSTPQCPKCATGMQYVPAGVSKATGNPYNAFWGCPSCKHTTRAL